MIDLLDASIALLQAASRPGLQWGRILAVPVLLGLCAIGAWLADRRTVP